MKIHCSKHTQVHAHTHTLALSSVTECWPANMHASSCLKNSVTAREEGIFCGLIICFRIYREGKKIEASHEIITQSSMINQQGSSAFPGKKEVVFFHPPHTIASYSHTPHTHTHTPHTLLAVQSHQRQWRCRRRSRPVPSLWRSINATGGG